MDRSQGRVPRDLQPEVTEAVTEGWFPQGANVLDIGCGGGQIAAYLASQGYQVLGVDIGEEKVRRASHRWQEYPNLEFRTLDMSKDAADEPSFTALLDRGCFHTLPRDRYRDYARTVASYAESGAHFLLLAKVIAREDFRHFGSDEANPVRRILDELSESDIDRLRDETAAHITEAFAPLFSVVRTSPATLSRGDLAVPAIAARLERTGEPAASIGD